MASITDQFAHHIERSKTRARFLPRTHCWIWIGAQTKYGYGVAYFNGRKWPAHRLSYWLKHKTLQQDGRNLVCHTCDNRLCVNPEHLFLGTYHENNLDRIKSKAQLTLQDIAFIRKSTLPCAILAAKFKLSQRDIGFMRPKSFHDWTSLRAYYASS